MWTLLARRVALAPPRPRKMARALSSLSAATVSTFSESTSLLEMETKAHSYDLHMALTTVTIYEGPTSPTKVADGLRARLREVFAQNPWIAGRIAKRQGEKLLQLEYPPADAGLTEEHLAAMVGVVASGSSLDDLDLHSTRYEEIVKRVESSGSSVVPPLPKSFASPFKSEVESMDPVLRLTVVPGKDGAGFALVASMSHVIGDGATFFQIMRMLSADADANVYSMNPTRKHETRASEVEAVGTAAHAFTTSAPFIAGALKGSVFGNKVRLTARFLDLDEISAAKAREAESSGGGGFVSTNDVVTSGFANIVNPRVLGMAINFRDKIENVERRDAGNYEYVLWFDKGTYATPSDVRNAFHQGRPPFETLSGPLPGTWECLTSARFAMVNNHAFYKGELLAIDGCEEVLHLPVVPVDEIPFDYALVWRGELFVSCRSILRICIRILILLLIELFLQRARISPPSCSSTRMWDRRALRGGAWWERRFRRISLAFEFLKFHFTSVPPQSYIPSPSPSPPLLLRRHVARKKRFSRVVVDQRRDDDPRGDANKQPHRRDRGRLLRDRRRLPREALLLWRSDEERGAEETVARTEHAKRGEDDPDRDVCWVGLDVGCGAVWLKSERMSVAGCES